MIDGQGVESVAIGYLHAFVNPEHEQRTAEWLQAARPGLSLTLASEVCPEIREFERLSTACANAYVRPLMARYLERLAAELSSLLEGAATDDCKAFVCRQLAIIGTAESVPAVQGR